MRNQYVKDLERELERVYVGSNIMVISLGKDKFILGDERKATSGRGAALLRAVKALPERCGYERFWQGMRAFKITETRRSIEISTESSN